MGKIPNNGAILFMPLSNRFANLRGDTWVGDDMVKSDEISIILTGATRRIIMI